MAEGDYTANAYTTVSGYADCNTYTDNTIWRVAIDDQPYVPWGEQPTPRKYTLEEVQKQFSEYPKEKIKIEGVETMTLYDVYLVYAEDRKNPIVINKFGVIARDEEDAKIKSGLMKEVQDEWDADYLNFICKEIGNVKVKEKPKEVKQIK